MENQNVSAKKKVGGVILDILTVGLLFASFAALFYSGFIIQSSTFPLGALCAITAVGLLLLFLIGAVSCLSSKVKNNCLTVGFLVFSAVQLVALIVNLTLLLGIMTRLFSVDDLPTRLTYLITTLVVLVGYVASISYFSNGTVNEISEDDETAADDDEAAADDTDDTAEAGVSEESDADVLIEDVEEIDQI